MIYSNGTALFSDAFMDFDMGVEEFIYREFLVCWKLSEGNWTLNQFRWTLSQVGWTLQPFRWKSPPFFGHFLGCLQTSRGWLDTLSTLFNTSIILFGIPKFIRLRQLFVFYRAQLFFIKASHSLRNKFSNKSTNTVPINSPLLSKGLRKEGSVSK